MERYEHAVVNRVHILRLHGFFSTADDGDAQALTETLVGCHTAETPCVVINWAGVTAWNSMGLGGLIQGLLKIQKLGGYYRTCALTENHKRFVSMIGGMGGFSLNFFETEEEAVRACPEFTRPDN